MSNTTPKFYVPESNPEADPTSGVAAAWDVFDGAYHSHYRDIIAVTHKIAALSFDAWATKAQFNEPLSLDAALSEKLPEFMAAINGLKRAFDKVQGKKITWNQWQRGEVIGTDESLLDENTIVHYAVRDEPTYPEWNGFIVGNIIGPDPHLGSLNAWIDVADSPEQPTGLHHSLFEMYGIRISDSTDS